MLFIAGDPGRWPWRSSWEPACASLQGWDAGCAAMPGADSSAGSHVGLLGAGEMLLALLRSPHCSIFAEEPCGHPAGERHAQIFFPLLPLALGLEKAGEGRCSPERGGMLVPRVGIRGTIATLDHFFPVIRQRAAGPAGCVHCCLSFAGTTMSPFPR